MKPFKITDKNSLVHELVSVSSALHTNDDGGLIEGAEHALEHLENVLANIDAGIEGEVQRRMKEERIKMEWRYDKRLEEALENKNIIKSVTKTVEVTFQNASNAEYDFTSRIEQSRFMRHLIERLSCTICK